MSDAYTIPHIDRNNGTITFQRYQDAEPIVDFAKEMEATKAGRGEFGRLIAMIPNVLLEKWIIEDGVNYLALPGDEFGRLIKRKLRDPQYAFLRTDII